MNSSKLKLIGCLFFFSFGLNNLFSQTESFFGFQYLGKEQLQHLNNNQPLSLNDGELINPLVHDNYYKISFKNSLDFPKEIFNHFDNILSLYIEGSLYGLDSIIHLFPNLIEVVFVNIDQSYFNYTIKILSNVKSIISLEVHSSSVFFIPDNFLSLQNLKRLELNNLLLHELPDSFSQLSNLLHLSILFTSISSLSFISNEMNLKYLNLGYNGFNGVPKEVSLFKSLEFFDFSGNNFYISDQNIICELENIKTLILKSCGLESFPSNLKCLMNLENLSLSYNRISELSDIQFFGSNFSYLEIVGFLGDKNVFSELRKNNKQLLILSSGPDSY
jgi:Leucine-rich repeat (LRR) protein